MRGVVVKGAASAEELEYLHEQICIRQQKATPADEQVVLVCVRHNAFPVACCFTAVCYHRAPLSWSTDTMLQHLFAAVLRLHTLQFVCLLVASGTDRRFWSAAAILQTKA